MADLDAVSTVGTNWAGVYAYQARGIIAPADVESLREAVAAGSAVRALGTRHSFNDLADTRGVLVRVDALDPTVVVSDDRTTADVPAGASFGSIALSLESEGVALANLGSLPHISVAGACLVGTHGSGIRNGNLASLVAGMDIVTAGGDLRTVSRGDADFDGAVVSLGLLGIVTRLRLDVVPSFAVRQRVFVGLPWESLLDGFDDVMGAAYSVSVFTHWGAPQVEQVWVKSVAGDPAERDDASYFGAVPADRALSPLGDDAVNTTEQGGVSGPWFDRLPHFRFDETPSHGDEIQSEYFVPRDRAGEALRLLRGIASHLDPHLLISEVRTVRADTLWMSTAVGYDVVALHFTWRNDPEPVRGAIARVEAALAPLDARPHWAKWSGMAAADILPLYERSADFARLVGEWDPTGKFANDYARRVLGIG